MAALKYSRQREAIKEFLKGRLDHPTADMVYDNIKIQYPNISLGTVYRNLSLLVSLGEAIKITTPNGPDRFDAKTEPHNHFICRQCHSVIDLEMPDSADEDLRAAKNFPGIIESHTTHFFGLCENCTKKVKKEIDKEETA